MTSDPPETTVTGCGTPDEEALLYPIIDDDSGKSFMFVFFHEVQI